MEKEITILRRKFKSEFLDEGTFFTNFKTKQEIYNWFDSVLNSGSVKRTNFGGNPCDQNSFIEIEIDGKFFTINPPKTKNGDADWVSYGEKFGFYVEVTS